MFKKRETPLQNMTYIALMCAINVIFVLLTTILPYLFLLIIFLLPLTSVIIYLFCKKRFFPIYAISTIALCLIFNLWRVTDTIFYVVPSIVTGFLFGVCIERKVPVFFTILLTTIAQVALTYASFPLIKLIVEVDTIEYFLRVFQLSEFEFKDYLPPIFILAISSIQILFTFLIVKEEIAKLKIEVVDKDINAWVVFGVQMSLIIFSIIFVFIYGPISLLLLGFTIYIGVYQCVLLFFKNKILFLVSIISAVVIEFLIFGLFSQKIEKPNAYLLLLVIPLIMNIVSISNYCLENHRNKDKLNKG